MLTRPRIRLPGNMLANSGFESGADGSKAYLPSGSEAVFEATPLTFHRGGASGHLKGFSSRYHGGMYQNVNLEPNSVCLFSAWIRSKKVGVGQFETSLLCREYYGALETGPPPRRKGI